MSDTIWSIVLIVGVIGWIASTFSFIFKAFPARDKFEVKAALKWGVVLLCSFFVWIVGLLNA